MELNASFLLTASPFTQMDEAVVVIGALILMVVAAALLLAASGRRKPPEQSLRGQPQKPAAADEAHRSMQTAFDALPVPVCIFDLETSGVVYVNESWVKLLEYDSAQELCGRKMSDTLCALQKNEVSAAQTVKRISGGIDEGLTRIDVEFVSKGGKTIEADTLLRRIDFMGRQSAVCAVKVHDEQNEAELSLAKAIEREKDTTQAKIRFLADISHEIRQPLNGIILTADALLGDALTPEQERHVNDIKTSAESIMGIITEMLDISKIRQGNLVLSLVDVDLYALLKNVAAMMSFSAQSRGLNFLDDIRLNSPEYALIDDVRFKQIVIKLLSNAMKYTNEGHVKFSAKIEDGNIKLAVSDTGTGISPEELPHVFMTFEQTGIKNNRATAGSGFGLSITKSLVELMKGEIWVESVRGKGSTFYVTLPFTPGDGSKVEEEEGARHIFAPTAEILFVDDIQTNLTIATGLMRLFGIAADVALSGFEAIDLVKVKDYDIVFMDYMMPDMDGLEAMQAIRCMGDKYVNLPIIALTANAMTESRELLLASGMNDFLPKPMDKERIEEILIKWLPSEKVELGVKQAVKPSAYSDVLAAASSIEGLDINLALSRISCMHDVLEDTIKLLAYALGERQARMKSLLEAGDLRAFTIEIHGLKGSLAGIGATRNAELATELELAARAGNILLCEQKYAVFADIITDFAEQLKSIFPKAESGHKSQGDIKLLELKTLEAIDCLNRFEAKEALKLLDEIDEFTFGEKADAALSEAKSLIELFKYKNAASLLKGIAEK